MHSRPSVRNILRWDNKDRDKIDLKQLMQLLSNENRTLVGSYRIYNTVKHFLQQAYKEGVYGSKYVWIIVGWYNEDWWTKSDVECKGEQLLEAAANIIETLALPLSTSQQPTISDRVSYCTLTSEQHLRAHTTAGKDQPRKIKNTYWTKGQRRVKVLTWHNNFLIKYRLL